MPTFSRIGYWRPFLSSSMAAFLLEAPIRKAVLKLQRLKGVGSGGC